MRDGSVKMNPGVQHPDALQVAGPTDPRSRSWRCRLPMACPSRCWPTCRLHYVGGWRCEISADYFGYFDRALLQRCPGNRSWRC